MIAFCVIVAAWTLIGGLWEGRWGVDQVVGGLFSSEIDEDTPNWGDVAEKIGELSTERAKLQEEVQPQSTGSVPQPTD